MYFELELGRIEDQRNDVGIVGSIIVVHHIAAAVVEPSRPGKHPASATMHYLMPCLQRKIWDP